MDDNLVNKTSPSYDKLYECRWLLVEFQDCCTKNWILGKEFKQLMRWWCPIRGSIILSLSFKTIPPQQAGEVGIEGIFLFLMLPFNQFDMNYILRYILYNYHSSLLSLNISFDRFDTYWIPICMLTISLCQWGGIILQIWCLCNANSKDLYNFDVYTCVDGEEVGLEGSKNGEAKQG